MQLNYRPGKGNPVDYMKSENTFRHSKVAEEYLNFSVSSSKPKALSVEQITEASNKDPIIQEVVSRMLKGEWKSTPKDIRVQPYFRIRDKLTIAPTEHGIVLLFENRLVIPLALRADVVPLAHEGHQGLVKTKQLLRDKVWFPGINQQDRNHFK